MAGRTWMCAGALALAALAAAAPTARAADLAPAAFADPSFIELDAETNSQGTGDFNGDGRRDLFIVTPKLGGSRIIVRLGQAAGGFGGPQTTAITAAAYSPFVADLNGDGKDDVVLGNQDGLKLVTVLLSDGTGKFTVKTFATADYPSSVAAGDFTNDHKADIVIANGNSTGPAALTLYSGDGTGNTFTRVGDYALTGGATSLAVGKVDQDSLPDIVAGVNDLGGGEVELLKDVPGTESGQPFPFRATARIGQYPPSTLLVTDLNGDGVAEVAASDGRNITVLASQNNTLTQVGTSYSTSGTSLAAADFNGDGVPDLLTDTSDGFGVRLGNGDRTYGPEARHTVESDVLPLNALADDANADGRADVVLDVASSNGDYFFVLANATRTAVASAPDALQHHTIPVAYSVPAFASLVASVDLYAKGPADSAFAKFATVAPGSGHVDYQAAEGDGEYDFYAVGRRANGAALDAPTVGDAATQLTLLTTLSADAPDFGRQDVGVTGGQLPVVITNTGTENLRVSNPAIAGANAGDYAITADHCAGVEVAPGNQCTIGIRFTPGDLGARAATLGFTANNAGDPAHTVALGGTGTAPPTTLSVAAPDLGRQVVGSTGDAQRVIIANTGANPLHVADVTIGGPNAGDFAVSGDSCSGTAIAPGSGCSVDVRFTPGDLGARAATLNFTANTTPSAANSVTLAGTGVRPPTTLSADPAAFGGVTVGVPAPVTLAVTNTGGAPLYVTGAAIGGANAGDFAITGDHCSGVAVAPGNQCTVTIAFTPGAAGARAAALVLAANVPGDGAVVALAGSGVVPVVAPKPKPRRIQATLAFNFNAGPRTTTLHSLVVKGFPSGATVVAKLGKKQITKRNAHGSVALKDLIRKPLKAGTKLTVTVSKAGMVTVVKTLTIRARKAPKVATRY